MKELQRDDVSHIPVKEKTSMKEHKASSEQNLGKVWSNRQESWDTM